MKRWIVRIAVPIVLLGGAVGLAPQPAEAGQWRNGPWLYRLSECEYVGSLQVQRGYWQAYNCVREQEGWRLRGFIN